MIAQSIDRQGHRGCRGLMPENTIPAFIEALKYNVNTLELDVVISKDKKVVVSHEPYMNHIICLDPDGNEIEEKEAVNHNLFLMDYDEIKKYDCGQKFHPTYPEQKKMDAYKPLLSEMIEAVENYVSENKLSPPKYNIEIKCQEKYEGKYHPNHKEFTDLVVAVIKEKKVIDRCNLQSFDMNTCRYIHEKYPNIALAFLTDKIKSPKKQIKKLGFKPEIYSPYFKLLTKKRVKYLHKKGIKAICWTVNETADMEKMIELDVDGIITDYPNRLEEVLGKL